MLATAFRSDNDQATEKDVERTYHIIVTDIECCGVGHRTVHDPSF